MVDYIAISEANLSLLEEISKGLYRGCELARVSLSGGEIAQVRELLAQRPGGVSYDIVGTAIGTVAPDGVLVGQDLKAGDMLIGLESNGLHSNGYSLVRKICFEIGKFSVSDYVSDFQAALGDELLRPTRIYVNEIAEIRKSVEVKALFHITGDGFFNLTRTSKPAGYRIDHLPERAPIFRFLQRIGNVPDEEMFRVFNMGVGFALVVPPDSSNFETVKRIAGRAGYNAYEMGEVIDDPNRTIYLEPVKLVGRAGSFSRT